MFFCCCIHYGDTCGVFQYFSYFSYFNYIFEMKYLKRNFIYIINYIYNLFFTLLYGHFKLLKTEITEMLDDALFFNAHVYSEMLL